MDLVPASHIFLDPTVVPEKAGVYLAYFRREGGLLALTQALHPLEDHPTELNGRDLLYIGGSEESIRDRVLKHVKGDSRMSSLRRTVGVLLRDQLGLDLYGRERAHFHFGPGEERLSQWFFANCSFAFIETANPFQIERFLIGALAPPLNISLRKTHPFTRRLLGELTRVRREPLRAREVENRYPEARLLRWAKQTIRADAERLGQSN